MTEQDNPELTSRPSHVVLTVACAILLGYFFAHIEIQIEGAAGWATSLPTWRIENHWLLDVFWGGRAMTGYHAWTFPFIFLFFHFPLLFMGHWSCRAECRALGCMMLFWISEDFLWFALNPAFGLAHFAAATVPWHKHWWWLAPTDYWIFSFLAIGLLWYSYSHSQPVSAASR